VLLLVTHTHSRKDKSFGLVLMAIFFLFTIPIVSAAGLDTGVIPLPVFSIFIILSLILGFAGLGFNSSIMGTVGFLLLFICGFVIQGGDLGLATTSNVIDNGGGNTTITKVYEGWDGANHHIVGYLLMVFAVVMWALVMVSGGDPDEF